MIRKFETPVSYRGGLVAWPSRLVEGLSSKSLALALLDRACRDNFDKNRSLAYQCLLRTSFFFFPCLRNLHAHCPSRIVLPRPLVVATSVDGAGSLCKTGLEIVNSVRGQESDGGALLVRFLFNHYVDKLGWTLSLRGGDVKRPSSVSTGNCKQEP